MKIKNSKNITDKKKRVIATVATIALGGLLCAGHLSSQKENVSKSTSIKENVYQDINGNWVPYKQIEHVVYGTSNGNKHVRFMTLIETNDNEKVYQSITEPDIYLVETVSEKDGNYNYDYKICTTSSTAKQAIKGYISDVEVEKTATVIGFPPKSFEKIALQEKLIERYINGENLVEATKLLGETNDTLLKYNMALKNIGSKKVLTEEDLRIINENCIYSTNSLKLADNTYTQVGDDYKFIETEDGSFQLRFVGNYDMLTGLPRVKNDYTIIDDFANFVSDNNVEPIGYNTQKWPAWGDRATEFVRTNYGEDVLYCLRENGFPLVCYDVNDLVHAYYQSKFANLALKR